MYEGEIEYHKSCLDWLERNKAEFDAMKERLQQVQFIVREHQLSF